MLPIAHAGHWALYVLYAVPIVIVLASVVTTTLRERRAGDAEEASAPAAEEPGMAPFQRLDAGDAGDQPDGGHSRDG